MQVGRAVRGAAWLWLFALLAGCGGGDGAYPDRPIILICPWAAGGGSDRVARQVAVGLERELGVPVNVVNATGASGVIGHTRGALARPDGYTITLATAELNMLHWRGLSPITHEDFLPGVLLNLDPAAVFVRNHAPWQSLAELNAELQANSRTLQASGTALGGIWHVAMAGWLDAIGVPIEGVRWISIEGATPSLQELMAGGLDLVCCSLPEARALLEAGEIRALGVMAAERLEQFPQVPTFAEQGVAADLGTWRGIVLPKGLPEDRAQVLVEALGKVVQADEFRAFMRQAGFNWAFEQGDDFRHSLAQWDRSFGVVLTSEAFVTMGDEVIGPMAFPAVLGVIGGLTFFGLLASRQLGTSATAEDTSRAGLQRVAEVLAGVLFYLLAAEAVGFVITAWVLVSVLTWRMGGGWRAGLLVATVVVPVVYHVFAVLLRVPLPRGVFGW